MILNYTTSIEPEQTIGEIQKLLSRYNVRGILTNYDGQQVSALSFQIAMNGQTLSFRLPCNWRSVRELFKSQGITSVRHKDKSLDNQAIRTAWRIIKVWVEAQLNLVEINMVTLPQVFLPYAVMKDGRTLAEKISEEPGFLLGPGTP